MNQAGGVGGVDRGAATTGAKGPFAREKSCAIQVRAARRWLTLLLAAIALACSIDPARAEEKPARKPGISFLLSAILPGAGQLYNGNDRGYIHLGIEAAAWFARFSYLDAGNRREGEYEAYARRHWSFDIYRPPYDDRENPDVQADFGNWTPSNDSLLVWFQANDLQQYYEEIGKYEKYRGGWDDFDTTYDPANDRALSPNRKRYREMREQSNDLLNSARLAAAALVVNRVVSAVDAFRTVRGRQPERSAYRLESGFRGGLAPRAEIRLVRLLP